MRSLMRLMRTVVLGAVCPWCDGAEGGCDECSGQGWINI